MDSGLLMVSVSIPIHWQDIFSARAECMRASLGGDILGGLTVASMLIPPVRFVRLVACETQPCDRSGEHITHVP